MDVCSSACPFYREDAREAVNRHKTELGAVFVEGWQACCDDFSRRHNRQPGVACDAWTCRGGRQFCAEFLENLRRRGGDISLAAAADGVYVNGNNARRFFQHTRQQATGRAATDRGGWARDPREGEGQGGKRPAPEAPWHRDQQPRQR